MQTSLVFLNQLDNTTFDDDEINHLIINERNKEIASLEKEIEALAELQLSINELVTEQSDSLDLIVHHVHHSSDAITEGTLVLQSANNFANSLKSAFFKGALVSTGVTGIGTVAAVLLNPIVGGLTAVFGVSGLIFCITQL